MPHLSCLRLYLQNILRIPTLIASIATNLVCPTTFPTWIMQWSSAWSPAFTLASMNYSPHSSWAILLIYGRSCHVSLQHLVMNTHSLRTKAKFMKITNRNKPRWSDSPFPLWLHLLSLLLWLYLLQSSLTVLTAFPKHQRYIP